MFDPDYSISLICIGLSIGIESFNIDAKYRVTKQKHRYVYLFLNVVVVVRFRYVQQQLVTDQKIVTLIKTPILQKYDTAMAAVIPIIVSHDSISNTV